MKTKIILITVLLSAGLVASASAAPRGNGNRGASRPGTGEMTGARGNPNSTGTPLRDGSGKATAPGKGAKDGTGTQANCPNPPPTT